ncbi:organomercurial lyase [Streptomyces sp. NBC_00237]|uniref:organomercurial lyase n=1 Tax=Streptomyces sp. NBC_00237 TaxID=2975687 RepID=UPI00225C2042|nr:organomercurial lyase [Streptomyces sp. NBC_00237]MCX5205510.1 organomercurial lyase [Streptomyces sp. NBC_00237]
MPHARVQQLSDQLVAKWTSPQGVELMAAGAKVVAGLLEHGPLTPQEAARLLGWPADQVLDRFHAMNFGLETDPDGRITGAGVSLNDRHPHTMELHGRRLFGWCAMDVLMFPVVFKERASTVTSRCPTTREPISLTVTPDGTRDVSPSTAAVTLAPATGADIREVFCNRVNFYGTAQLAEQVAAQDPDLAVCSVDTAWTVGKRLADLF